MSRRGSRKEPPYIPFLLGGVICGALINFLASFIYIVDFFLSSIGITPSTGSVLDNVAGVLVNVGSTFIIIGSIGIGIGIVIVIGLGLIGNAVLGYVSARGHRRGSQAPADLHEVQPLAPRSLRWVQGLLPGDEGTAWLAEMNSCLAETLDKGERRRYVRSYRRTVPQLIWTSWTEYLSRSRSEELS